MRTIFEADIIAIKGATDQCFREGGGVTSLPGYTRNNVSTLSKYASITRIIHPNGTSELEYGDRVIPVDIAIEADRRAKHPYILGEAARQLGYGLVPLAEAPREGAAISERDAHVVLSKAMGFSRLLIDALDDERLDALEKKQLCTALLELIATAQGRLDRVRED